MLVIDTFEQRDIAMFDVPGAYLHAKMPDGKTILLKLMDEFVDIMCQINPEYSKHVRMEKGEKSCTFKY